jgi:hypothetical protein
VRLGVTDAATTPLGFVGVVLLAALLVATGLRSGSGVAAVLVIDSSAECQGGIETPPAACNSPPISRQQAVSGSSSGTDLARGSSGG